MYLPPHFAETDADVLRALVRAHPLGALVRRWQHGLEADHLPFLVDPAPAPYGTLLAHVARANPLWQEVADGDEVVVIFRGPDGYISPNWYPGKGETHRRVPTWNYEVVHAHGTVHVHDDEKFIRRVVALLTREHEAAQPRPWSMADAPADYLAEMVGKVVGLEVRLTRLEGKRKLGQNHEMRDRVGAAHGLDEAGNAALARAMRESASERPRR